MTGESQTALVGGRHSVRGRLEAVADRPEDAILALPVGERLTLVDSTWESIRDDAGVVPVGEGTRTEMQRRLAVHRVDPETADDLDIVLARLRDGR